MATKLTSEQKAANKILTKIQEIEDAKVYELQQQEHLAMYKASIPKRMMDAQALASILGGVAVHLKLTETGPSVRFEYENHRSKIWIDDTITYDTEEWELECLEAKLMEIKVARDACEARLIVAQGAWNRLSDEERAAIKEHHLYLR